MHREKGLISFRQCGRQKNGREEEQSETLVGQVDEKVYLEEPTIL